jgi:hypothetical protein
VQGAVAVDALAQLCYILDNARGAEGLDVEASFSVWSSSDGRTADAQTASAFASSVAGDDDDLSQAHGTPLRAVRCTATVQGVAWATALEQQLHRILARSVRALHAIVPLQYSLAFAAVHQLRRLPNSGCVSYVSPAYMRRSTGSDVTDCGSAVGHRASLLGKCEGPNSLVDVEELLRHLSRCLPLASVVAIRRALLFLHNIGAIFAREVVAEQDEVSKTAYLQPQFLARVLWLSTRRVFKKVPFVAQGACCVAVYVLISCAVRPIHHAVVLAIRG